MPNVQDIRRRIRSVKNTQQITRAMKMVAAAKLRRAQDNVMGTRPYSDRLNDFLARLLARPEVTLHPLAAEREVKKLEVVVVSADKGLCGGFNANVMRAATRFILKNQEQGREIQLTLLGKKAWDYFRRRPFTIREKHTDLFRTLTYEDAVPIADELIAHFEEGGADQVVLIGNTFKNIITQLVRTVQLLPVAPAEAAEEDGELFDPLFEPGEEKILFELIPRVVRVLIARALLESLASEHAARMTAMEAATTNAGEMIDRLTLTMNRARQASITKELIEIVSAGEALS